ncbi:MAG TPA: TlpA disulfide reductase family protein [Flavobacterium sp.]|jgi:thiol-disulfide isomerase/thioredoxin|nr:TlpA disulfide reductase family protein [Flavobacterium sp.]
MKKSILGLIALTAIVCMASFTYISSSKIENKEFSKKALSENLMSFDGKQIPFEKILKKYKGKNLVIEVWGSWCSDCIKAMPDVKELQANNPEVSFVFISMDKTAEKWKAGIEKYQLKGDHYMANDQMKGEFGKAIELDWIPRYIVINKKGQIEIYRAVETDFEKINTTLKKLQ